MEYVSQSFSDVVKMWSIEQQHITKQYLSSDDAFKALFYKQNFNKDLMKESKNIVLCDEIRSWKDIPWLDDILIRVLIDSMKKNDRCDTDVKVLTEREDGIKLCLIEKIDISVDSIAFYKEHDEEEEIDDFGREGYDAHEYYPKICVVHYERLFNRNMYPDFTGNDFSISFYKKRNSSTRPSVHYWGEK